MQPITKTLLAAALSVSVLLTGNIVLATAKPLSNADIIAMLKAGLPENTIILSI